MGLFGNKKEDKKEVKKVEEKPKKTVAKKATKAPVVSTTTDLSWVLQKPRVTEKASIVPEKVNAYVFEVHRDATANQVKDAVTAIHKVKPIKVNIAKIPSKKVTRRSRRGVKKGEKSGGKKAYVYLKKGERIEFV